MDKLLQRFAAVALRILDLRADFGERLALPCHLDRGYVPQWMPRHTTRVKIRRSMARRASHTGRTKAKVATDNQGLMRVAVVALSGSISPRVAIHAAGMHDDFAGLGKKGNGAFSLVADGRERSDWS
jgi:hypothetical protein